MTCGPHTYVSARAFCPKGVSCPAYLEENLLPRSHVVLSSAAHGGVRMRQAPRAAEARRRGGSWKSGYSVNVRSTRGDEFGSGWRHDVGSEWWTVMVAGSTSLLGQQLDAEVPETYRPGANLVQRGASSTWQGQVVPGCLRWRLRAQGSGAVMHIRARVRDTRRLISTLCAAIASMGTCPEVRHKYRGLDAGNLPKH